jgi:hypothetical protein
VLGPHSNLPDCSLHHVLLLSVLLIIQHFYNRQKRFVLAPYMPYHSQAIGWGYPYPDCVDPALRQTSTRTSAPSASLKSESQRDQHGVRRPTDMQKAAFTYPKRLVANTRKVIPASWYSIHIISQYLQPIASSLNL